MTENKRVVITGRVHYHLLAMMLEQVGENVNGIDTITRIDTEDYNVHLAGELKDFNIEDHIEKSSTYGPFHTICGSCSQAVEDAKLEINDETANRMVYGLVQGLVVWKRLKQHIQHFKIRVQEE